MGEGRKRDVAMTEDAPFAPPLASAAVLSTGRLTLDAIITTGPDAPPPRSQAGGTCGNVLANLAYLGWPAYPLTHLGDDDPGERFCRDLARWGVRLDLIARIPGRITPVIVHHIRHHEDGPSRHSFSSRCPFCGQRLAGYEPLPLADVRAVLPRLPSATVFFTDRDSEGSLLLARTVAEQGGLVVFEPNYDGDRILFPRMLALCHVLKFARQRLPGLADRWPLREPALVVETLGGEGLRYRDQRHGPGEWQHLPALPVPVVRDAAGCGDWTTAGLIHRVGQQGRAGLLAASEKQVRQALRFGQALAAWNCAFEGARGGVYRVDRPIMQQSVLDLLMGCTDDPLRRAGRLDQEPAGQYCLQCGGKPPEVGERE
jgi:fructokinase